ncbi:GntR family transcriptional regulator [Catenuloplanes niger JCM 9533]
MPPYAQIRDQVAGLARDGDLAAGTRLPAVRALAEQLGLAVNTVARAYRELEQAGLVETRGRHGTVITARAAGASTEALRLAGQYATATRALGVPPEQALDLVRAALGLRADTTPTRGRP